MTALLSVNDVSTGYVGLEIVHKISIQVDKGEIVTIIGPNGAGKSTLLKAIAGVLTKFEGTVILNQQNVTKLSASNMVIAGASFVPQTDNIFPSLSIKENLEMGGFLRNSGINERIKEVLSMFPELEKRPNEKAGNLSGGQRQALAISRALMLDPVLLMLDEPTAALSPALREEIFDRIDTIRESGVAILMVEQNAKEALLRSDRGYVLVAGESVLEQTGPELVANPDVGRLFLGAERNQQTDNEGN
ncbi:MAG: ABC transporter ATP-binding protein [Chloroflexi bacterium]|nr:ABC transporter ATP-binding protein [Chloroflexota bacterium]|tara:strand:- start:16688 stop:17428 length:741 start_codon:yes stop_codon:yes gene_type:complete